MKQALALLVLAGAPLGVPRSQEPSKTDLSTLTDDELVARMPRVGSEWIQKEGEWELLPIVAELADRIERGVVLRPEQWKGLLLGTGALSIRARWPAGEPFAVSMQAPAWLRNTKLRLVPKGDGLERAEVGWFDGETNCGTYVMQVEQHWLYQRIGVLPPGPGTLVFELALERGTAYRPNTFVLRTPSSRSIPASSKPPAGVFPQGELAFDVEIVPTLDDAIPPRSTPEIDAAVRSTLSLAFDDWSSGRTAILVLDPDVGGDPRLAHLGLSLAIDLLHGTEVVAHEQLVASAYDRLASGISAYDDDDHPFAFTTMEAIPLAIEHDDAEAQRWSVRVTGTAEDVLALWPAEARWSGSVEITLAELVARERAVAPKGRGPWVYMPTFR